MEAEGVVFVLLYNCVCRATTTTLIADIKSDAATHPHCTGEIWVYPLRPQACVEKVRTSKYDIKKKRVKRSNSLEVSA